MKLYLAYGANTHTSSMAMRCPAAKYLCNIVLKNHSLRFRGVADVVPEKGSTVVCALWMITEECERALDRFEGFPNLYIKKYVTLEVDSRKSRMMLYVMRATRSESPAYDSYYNTLRAGYIEHNMPVAQLEAANQHAEDWAEAKRKEYKTTSLKVGLAGIDGDEDDEGPRFVSQMRRTPTLPRVTRSAVQSVLPTVPRTQYSIDEANRRARAAAIREEERMERQAAEYFDSLFTGNRASRTTNR
jgi:gamma-glutamylcyclotransferase (GGCT)/AIG2-like uncharacterized protein YtfP